MIKGVGIVNEDGSSDDTIYWNNVRFACQIMGDFGFIQVDTFSKRRGHSSSNVIHSVNDGRGIVIYRGTASGNWSTPFNVNPGLTDNGQKLPIIASITCRTMTLSPTESMVGEAWLKVGSVERPKGAVAFFGNTHSASRAAPRRGVCTRGFFRALSANIGQLGKACLVAKESIYVWFSNQGDYEGFNLLGDPELPVLTGIPKPLNVYYPQSIPIGNQDITIQVERLGLRLADALVCLWKGEEVYKYGYTNAQGEITLNIIPQTPGNILLTVTAQNSLFWEGTIACRPGSGPYLIYQDKTLFDPPPQGNGNGVPNPGEEIWAKIILKNIGESPASRVSATLRTLDPNCLIIDSIQSYGTIPPNGVKENEGYFIFRLSSDISDGYTVQFSLSTSDSQGQRWVIPLSVVVRAGKLVFFNYLIRDSPPGGNNNQVFEPGESGKLLCGIRNTGGDRLQGCYGLLRTNELLIKIIDSTASFGSLLPNEERYNTQTPFSLTIAPQLLGGTQLRVRIVIWGGEGFYQFKDSADMVITIGGAGSSLPTGPDAYGYYAYDNTDVTSGRAPIYEWENIMHAGLPVPGATNANDTTVTLKLPFTFRYYGVDYDSISISSNGFICLGRSTYRSGNNRPLPSTESPIRGVFPFWDDLDTRGPQGIEGEVYYLYDRNNNRYIIEYCEVRHFNRQQKETFEIILYDPRYYPTPTGDGEILFQYYSVADASSCTVGQQNHTATVGLQYLYNGTYGPNAAPLVAGRAIKFTTAPPVGLSLPWVTLERLSVDDSPGNGNGILEPGETALLVVHLKNRGRLEAISLTARLRSRDNDLVINDSSFTFGDVFPNQEINNGDSPFRFTISNAPGDTVLSFLLYLTSTGYTNALFFSLGMGSSTAIQNTEYGRWNYLSNRFPTIMTAGQLNKHLSSLFLLYDSQGRLVVKGLPEGKSVKREIRPGVYFLSRASGPSKREVQKICVIR